VSADLLALVGEVWPVRRDGLPYGSDLVLHVARGTVDVGTIVEVPVGPGRSVQAAVTSVATRDPAVGFVKERIALPGQPPALGAHLDVRIEEVPPSQVVVMGSVTAAGATAAGALEEARPVCPWAAVFAALERFEDGLALMALFEADFALLANGEPPDYFLGCIASERAMAAVIADRIRAQHGGPETEWTYAHFYGATRAPLDAGVDERLAFEQRLLRAGVVLSAPE
jgi:hypothetical protein